MLAWCAALGCLVWPSAYAADKPQRLRAALFVNGTLGDKSFYDSAAAGLRAAVRSENIFARVVEGGVDPSRWEPALADLVDSEEFDVIVVGTFTMVPLVEKLSMQYPAARFVMFDASVGLRAVPLQQRVLHAVPAKRRGLPRGVSGLAAG